MNARTHLFAVAVSIPALLAMSPYIAAAECVGTPDYCTSTTEATPSTAPATSAPSTSSPGTVVPASTTAPTTPTTTTPPEFAIGTARMPTTTTPTRVLIDTARNECDPDTRTDRYLMPCDPGADKPATTTTAAPITIQRLPDTGAGTVTLAMLGLVVLLIGIAATWCARRADR